MPNADGLVDLQVYNFFRLEANKALRLSRAELTLESFHEGISTSL